MVLLVLSFKDKEVFYERVTRNQQSRKIMMVGDRWILQKVGMSKRKRCFDIFTSVSQTEETEDLYLNLNSFDTTQ